MSAPPRRGIVAAGHEATADAAATLDEADIVGHVKAKLASFKAPKRVLTIDTIGRAPNGKVDYKALKTFALTELGIDALP